MRKACNIIIGLIFGLHLITTGQNINRQMVNQLLQQLPHTPSDTSRIKILVELGKFHVFKPGEVKTDLDSGLNYLSKARFLADSLHSTIWQHEVESMLIIQNLESEDSAVGMERFAKLMFECKKKGDRGAEAVANYRVACWITTRAHDFTLAESLYRKSMSIYAELNDPVNEMSALKDISIVHLNQGKVDLAESELLLVLKTYKSIQYPRIHYVYEMLSNVYRLKGEFNKALDYAIQCVESMEKTKDTLSAAVFYADLARVYYDIGDKQESTVWFKKSLTEWRKEGLANFQMFNTAGFIVRDMIEQNRAREAIAFLKNLADEIPPTTQIQHACIAQHYAYCYDALGNFPLAEKYYLEAVQLYGIKTIQFESALGAERDIGKFYLKVKQYEKASDHLEKALLNIPQKNSLGAIKDIQRMLFQVDSIQGNYASAIRHLHLYETLRDSILDEAKSRQIEELQIQYETGQKENEIQLLTKQSELKQSELSRGKLTRNVMIAAIILLFLLFGTVYNRYLLKQRSNKQLLAQQNQIREQNNSLQTLLNDKDVLLAEKEALMKEVHHRVKNNLQIVISLLNTQSKFLNNKDAITAIRDSEHRMQALSLIHQKLYQDNLALVNMNGYIQQLVGYLKEGITDSHPRRIHFGLNVDPVDLDVSKAVPIGLILNEAITNSIKYAFPQESDGRITVSLKNNGPNEYILTVTDDGIGMPPDFDMKTNKSMGLGLIQTMAEQLYGSLRIENENGTNVKVVFRSIEIKKNKFLSNSFYSKKVS